MTKEEMRKIEYHEGYFCAGNGIPFDENQSEDWKEGYLDGMATLNCDQEIIMKMIYEDLKYHVFALDKDNFPTHETYNIEDIDSAKRYAEELGKKFDDVYIEEKRLYKVK